MATNLTNIMEAGGLTSLFQPIVSMSDGSIYAYEALSRGPKGSALEHPERLFEVAAQMRLGDKLNFHAAKLAVDSFYRAQLPGYLFVNLTPSALLALNDVEGQSFLKAVGQRTKRIVIELTEQERGGNWTQIRDAVLSLRRRGFALALDDFGEGFAGLRLFAELRPEFVKIDKHFIRGAPKDALCRQMVRSVCDIARASGARVIAEGIECDAELQIVQDAGAHLAQGFMIGRPEMTPATKATADFLATVSARLARDKQLANPVAAHIGYTPSLSANTPVHAAIEMMYLQGLAYVAVLESENFTGITSYSDLLSATDLTIPIGNIIRQAPTAAPRDSAHRVFESLPSDCLCIAIVVPETGDFLGLVDANELRENFMIAATA